MEKDKAVKSISNIARILKTLEDRLCRYEPDEIPLPNHREKCKGCPLDLDGPYCIIGELRGNLQKLVESLELKDSLDEETKEILDLC
jgi:hypothetical protein